MSDADYQWLEAAFAKGHIDDPEAIYQWSLRIAVAEERESQNAVHNALKQHLERMQRLEKLVEERPAKTYREAAAYYRLEAEKMLADGRVEPTDQW
jgi:hypothetical protein